MRLRVTYTRRQRKTYIVPILLSIRIREKESKEEKNIVAKSKIHLRISRIRRPQEPGVPRLSVLRLDRRNEERRGLGLIVTSQDSRNLKGIDDEELARGSFSRAGEGPKVIGGSKVEGCFWLRTR